MLKCLLVASIIAFTTTNCQYIDDFCTIESNGLNGKCLLLKDCPKAIEDLQQKQIFPQQCGFEGTQPIVCCVDITVKAPNIISTTPLYATGFGKKSREKCKEYADYVFATQTSAVLLANKKPIKVDKCASKAVELIVGGEKASPREFSHMALIGFDGENGIAWKCGGALISEQFVLTAGHCLFAKAFGQAKYVRLGDLNIERTDDDAQPQEFQVAERIYHPNYQPPSSYNDIALLKLDRPATLNIYVRPACLNTKPKIKQLRAVATGWGRVGFSKGSSSDLLKVTLEAFSFQSCKASFRTMGLKLRNGIQDNLQTCWGSHTEEKDTCQGDSGGPLQVTSDEYCMYDIIGVTSFGKSCGVVNTPGVYTRVSNYIEWIESVVWGT